MAGTIYLDRSYDNSDRTGILVGIGADPAQVSATVARWFETHVDARQCRLI
jgi:hypothetical protein